VVCVRSCRGCVYHFSFFEKVKRMYNVMEAREASRQAGGVTRNVHDEQSLYIPNRKRTTQWVATFYDLSAYLTGLPRSGVFCTVGERDI